MIVSDILMQLSRLQEVGITHIVCVKHPGKDVFIRANFPEHFRYLLLYVEKIFQSILFALNWKCCDYIVLLICTFDTASNVLAV